MIGKRLSKRFLGVIYVLVLLLSVLIVQPASAHVLKSDGDVSVILHIDPDDNPTSGEPTHYLLLYGDSTGRLMTSSCICRVAIQEHGTTLATQTPQPTYPFESDGTFTFPKGDIYDLVVTGKPKVPNAFQSFSLRYTVRVTQGLPIPEPFPVLFWTWIGIIVCTIATISGCLYYYVYAKHQKEKAKK